MRSILQKYNGGFFVDLSGKICYNQSVVENNNNS